LSWGMKILSLEIAHYVKDGWKWESNNNIETGWPFLDETTDCVNWSCLHIHFYSETVNTWIPSFRVINFSAKNTVTTLDSNKTEDSILQFDNCFEGRHFLFYSLELHHPHNSFFRQMKQTHSTSKIITTRIICLCVHSNCLSKSTWSLFEE
jgi:hypothetical protein